MVLAQVNSQFLSSSVYRTGRSMDIITVLDYSQDVFCAFHTTMRWWLVVHSVVGAQVRRRQICNHITHKQTSRRLSTGNLSYKEKSQNCNVESSLQHLARESAGQFWNAQDCLSWRDYRSMSACSRFIRENKLSENTQAPKMKHRRSDGRCFFCRRHWGSKVKR